MKPNLHARVYVSTTPGYESRPGTVREVRDPSSDTWPHDDSVAFIEFDNGFSAWFEEEMIFPCEAESVRYPWPPKPSLFDIIKAAPKTVPRPLTISAMNEILKDVWLGRVTPK